VSLWLAVVGIITYNYIPTEHRVLFVDLVEIVYSAVLSTLTSDAHEAGYSALPATGSQHSLDQDGMDGLSGRRSSASEVEQGRVASCGNCVAASPGPQQTPPLPRAPRTWEELVEVGGAGGACYWCIAGTLPERVSSRGSLADVA